MTTSNLKDIKQQLEQYIEDFKQGKLTEQKLRQVIEGIDSIDSIVPHRQDLLYLQTGSTSLMAPVQGMLMVENGEISEGPADPNDWPYKRVIDAVRDGWRIIQFPNLALMMDESKTYGLGCEFILEKWR